MAHTASGIEAFRAAFGGQALTPADDGYDSARSVWNGTIDRRPAVIARCATAAYVAEAIRHARANGLEIAVRGGGHSYAGYAVCGGGMMVHLGGMNGVTVDPVARRAVCGGGTTWAEFDAATQQHGLATPGGFPYVALQQLFNESAPWGLLAYEKALYLDDLSDAAIATIGEHASRKQSPLSFCPTFDMTGAYHARRDADTAFGGSRSAAYVFNIDGAGPTRELYEADRAWVRGFWDAMRPHASGAGSYVNFMAEPDEDRVRAAYGPGKYARLARIKAQYDPENVFHLNANITPA